MPHNRSVSRIKVPFIAIAGIVLPVLQCHSQPLAFPAAVGHGKDASGGRNGSVYRVTTLANSGAGSFRDAVSQPDRIIIFDVGGYITLSSEVAMSRNLTIAGQSAPGGGIGIRGAEVSTGSSTNLIIRHVRFRPGSSADSGAHCVNFRGTNGILDQCSLEFGPWNNVGGVNANQLTIMRSLIADPIGQQFGAHMERLDGTCTWYQNIFANGHNRQPLSKINTIYINNVVYNYEAAYTCGNTSGDFSHDIIGNYYITGPATDTAANDYYQLGGNQSIYETGNLRDSNRDGVLNGSTTVSGEGTALGSPWSPLTSTIPATSAATAFRRNLSTVGAWPRDQVDTVILYEVRSIGIAGPNPLPSSQAVTGLGNSGFGTINGGITPLDSDLDGMPDYWEAVAGTALNSADAMTIGPDGYANIENYLNWLAEPHALTTTNTSIDIDLWQYSSGFVTASPLYYIDNPTNGTLSLISSHIARFTPAANVSGFGGFRFAVVSSDGLNMTNHVAIIISSLPPPSNLVWRGDGAANTWDTATANWDNGSSLVAFTSGDNVTFDDTGSNSPAINLAAPVTAGTISILSEQDYTFTGSGFAGGSKLFKVGAGTLSLNNASTFTGGVLINEGVVQLGDGIAINGSISGNVTNNGTLLFANPGNTTSAASISGTGEVIKSSAGTLTLSGAQTYANLTTINDGVLEFTGTPPPGNIINNGVLTFRPGGATTYAGNISGPGRVQTSASSITTTLSGANTFTGGLNVTAGNLQLASSQAAGRGPVTNSSSGLVYLANGVVITNDFTLTTSTTDLNMRCDSGTAVWAGNVVNLGSSASWRPGSDGGTLIFTGTAIQGSRNFIVPRGTVHFSSNSVVSASGAATALGRDSTDGNRSARITIRENAVMDLGPCSMGGARQGGYVVVTVEDAASLSTGINSFDLHNVNRATAYTELRLNGGTLATGGFIKTRTGATQFTTNAFNGGALRATQNNPAFLPPLSGLFALVQAGGAIFDDNGFVVTIGQPLQHDPALGATIDGGLIKSGSGTLTLTGTNTYTGGTIVSNGWLTLLINGSISNTAFIRVDAGATLHANNTVGATLPVTKGSLLGNGVILGRVVVMNNAAISPGLNGIGRLSCHHGVVLDPGSTSLFETDKASGTNDVIWCPFPMTLGGTITVTNLSGTLTSGDSFKLIDAPGYTGLFATVNLPPLDPGLAWTNQLSTSGTISVISTAQANPPVFGAVSSTGGDLVMSGSNGAPNATYYLLTATNILLPMTNWARVSTNQFGPDGSFNLTNPINPANPQLFHRLQLP